MKQPPEKNSGQDLAKIDPVKWHHLPIDLLTLRYIAGAPQEYIPMVQSA